MMEKKKNDGKKQKRNYCNPGNFSKLKKFSKLMILAFHIYKAINFHNLERFTVHFNPGTLNSKLLIFINSKNLRTIRKLIAYENFQDYSMQNQLVFSTSFSSLLLSFFPNIRDCFLRKTSKKRDIATHSIFLVLYVKHCFRFEYQ